MVPENQWSEQVHFYFKQLYITIMQVIHTSSLLHSLEL